MKLSQVFQYSIYFLVLLSSLIYGLAEEAFLPPGLTVPIALFCLYVIDIRRKLRIPQWLADSLGIVAFFFAGLEFFSDRPAAKLLAGSHLLIYLTWVVLIQVKSVAQYWRLIALATLQVAVAAVLTSAPQFGLLLVLYVFFSLWTLSVYSMYRAELRFTQADHSASNQNAIFSPVLSTTSRGARSPDGSGAVTRSRHASRAVSGIFAPSAARGTIQHDPDQRWINSRFVLGTFATANVSIVIGTIFFMLIPRLWFGRFSVLGDTTLDGRNPTTGYRPDVELKSSGEIQENKQPALRVRLMRVDNHTPVEVEEFTERLGYSEPMFRGSVLIDYEDSRWTTRVGARFSRSIESSSAPLQIVQDYQLEPIGTSVLFNIPPIVSGTLEPGSGRIGKHRRTGVLSIMDGQPPNDVLRYTLFSSWPDEPVRGRPAEVVTDEFAEFFLSQFNTRSVRDTRAMYLQFPGTLNRLSELAHRIAYRGSSIDDVPPRVRADRIEQFLRNSGEYTYSLKSETVNDKLDPVEDFLFERKQGDCKYFASSLALMLRTVGVPTRIINGFKGGETSNVPGELLVQQRHAHTWVEALIADDATESSPPRLSWVVYDPTPAARDEGLIDVEAGTSLWETMTKASQELWSNYIVQMSLNRQTQDIYAPIQNSAREWWTGSGGARGVLAQTAAGLLNFLKHPDQWVSWKGGLITFSLMAGLAGSLWISRRIWNLMKRWKRRSDNRRNAQTIRIEFYERFLALLSRYGWKRNPSQTQREFAEEFIGEFHRRFPEKSLGDLPRSITTNFYQCRFGLQPLSDDEIQTMQQNLTRLEAVLTQPANGNGQR